MWKKNSAYSIAKTNFKYLWKFYLPCLKNNLLKSLQIFYCDNIENRLKSKYLL